jgi:glyoxylase-like metal-dependent hydrolase (beta-lactamase superfamily II)
MVIASAQAASEQPERSIIQVAGDVYRFQNNDFYSVFMVTPEGVIVADPIAPEVATWLAGEIKQRFDLPVKYVLYSHDHWDHVSGAAAFPEAIIIAHDNAVPFIEASEHPIEKPDLTFSSALTLRLGGKEVRLYYFGPSHSNNLVHMYFPEERVVFAVAVAYVNRLPVRNFSNVDIDGMIASLKAIEALDADIVVPAHGPMGTMADLSAHRVYIETLRERVAAQLEAGRSLEQIKAAVTMPEYAAWDQYANSVGQNVEGMVHYLEDRGVAAAKETDSQ